tara:strand:+ start:2803 stop:3255 length:453 start_codon:yes stop_codon:yes gene_type:complete
MHTQCLPFFKKLKYILASLSLTKSQKKSNLSSPTVVKALKLKYPNASAVQLEQVEVSKWAASFTLKNKWHSALFDSHGNWLDTMTLVSLESLPKNVQENFQKSFVERGIKNIHQIDMNNKTIYEIKWTNGIFIWKLLYDVSGKMVGRLIS